MNQEKYHLAMEALNHQADLVTGKLPVTYSEYNDALWKAFEYGRKWERAVVTRDEIPK